MDLKEYATMYDVEDRHWWYAGLRNMFLQYWKKYIKIRSPRVLDVGCGTGGNLVMLQHGSEPIGIDFSFEAISFCRKRNLQITGVASATALPFGDENFDAVLSFDVLCHNSIPDKNIPLREMRRVLKPGGLVFLNLPAYQWLYSPHDKAYHQDRRFTRIEVERLLQGNGFEVVDATYWNTLLFPAAMAIRLWRRFSAADGSDLVAGSGQSMSIMVNTIMGVERALVRLASLPFGLSVFTVAQKV